MDDIPLSDAINAMTEEGVRELLRHQPGQAGWMDTAWNIPGMAEIWSCY